MTKPLKEEIRAHYGARAKAASSGSCCGSSASACCGDASGDPITGKLYLTDEIADLPDAAVAASLGCGNPTALAELKPGEVVLDLGSGGGIDVLLSAKRVGPTGKAYGLDMTDEMLALARENQRQANATNVEFLKGDIEAIPLPDATLDVIISNCVINLSTDKPKVFAEAFRTLRPGGRLAVSDVVFQGDPDLIPAPLRQMVNAWAGCVAGALSESEYIGGLKAAGFTDVSIQVTRHYSDEVFQSLGITPPAGVKLLSGFVRARKPSEA